MDHYQTGSDLDLYLDLLHEVTHIRQILEGQDVWNEAFPYHRRPTEIEGFAVAVSECRRLGLNDKEIREHLTNPWMTESEVKELLVGVNAFLASPKYNGGLKRLRRVVGKGEKPFQPDAPIGHEIVQNGNDY